MKEMERKQRFDFWDENNGEMRVRVPIQMKEDIDNIAANLNEKRSTILNPFLQDFVNKNPIINYHLSHFDENSKNNFTTIKITNVNIFIKRGIAEIAKKNNTYPTIIIRHILKKFIEDQLDSKSKKHLPY